MTPPLIKGGQGRTDEDVAAESRAWMEVTFYVVILAIAIATGIWAIGQVVGGGR